MAQKASAAVLKDFRGGLWWNEGGPPNDTFSTSFTNLDILWAAGGVEKRPPVRRIGDFLQVAATNISTLSFTGGGSGVDVCCQPWVLFDPSSDDAYVLLGASPNWYVKRCTLGATATVYDANTASLALSPTCMLLGSSGAGTAVYVGFRGNNPVKRVAQSGGAVTTMGTTFNDNFAAPTNGNMPHHGCSTLHLAYYFIGYTDSAGTAEKNKLRWSHPNRFEDWRTTDFIDVGLADEGIVALCSYKESLLIIKNNSVWLLTGYSPETFQLRQIYRFRAITGNVSGVVADPTYGVYFYVGAQALYHWDGSTISDVSGGLRDAIRDGRIGDLGVTAALIDGEYYMCRAANFTNYSSNPGTFILNPATGTWRHYSAWFTLLQPYQNSQTANMWKAYGIHGTGQFSASRFLESRGTATGGYVDDYLNSSIFGALGSNTYVCEYRSPWLDAGIPQPKKRWRRPFVVFNKRASASGSDPVTYNVTVYQDWDGVNSAKSGTVSAAKAANATEFSAQFGYGHATTGSDFDEGLKLGSLGTAKAVQLKIDTSGNPADLWGFDSITVISILKRVK
jgi:hypothetical protein